MRIFTDGYAWYFLVLIFFEVILISQKNTYAAEKTLPNTPVNEDLGYDYRVSAMFAILVFLPLLLLSGLSEQHAVAMGGDRALYVEFFKRYPSSISELSEFLTGDEKDTGFIVFGTIIKQIFGDNYNIWLTIIATICIFSLALTYRKFTSEIVMCAFLFFVSTDYMSWMMNGIRQFLVVAVIFASFPLLMKKKKLLFIAIVLLLYTVHSSCLVVLPMYFVALGKPFNKKTMSILFAMMMCVVFLDSFTGVLDSALETTDYSGVVEYMEQDDGTNILRVLVYSVPAIIAIVFRGNIPEDTPEIINISINMSLISMGFYVVSMFTSGIFIGRIPIYFSLFNYILLPWEIRTFFPKESRTLLNACLIGAYSVFYFLQMRTWGLF